MKNGCKIGGTVHDRYKPQIIRPGCFRRAQSWQSLVSTASPLEVSDGLQLPGRATGALAGVGTRSFLWVKLLLQLEKVWNIVAEEDVVHSGGPGVIVEPDDAEITL
eukprot:EG_transcript_64720